MSAERLDDLYAFRDFIDAQLGDPASRLTPEECLGLWIFENSSEAERAEALAEIQQGLEDMYAGREGSVGPSHPSARRRIRGWPFLPFPAPGSSGLLLRYLRSLPFKTCLRRECWRGCWLHPLFGSLLDMWVAPLPLPPCESRFCLGLRYTGNHTIGTKDGGNEGPEARGDGS